MWSLDTFVSLRHLYYFDAQGWNTYNRLTQSLTHFTNNIERTSESSGGGIRSGSHTVTRGSTNVTCCLPAAAAPISPRINSILKLAGKISMDISLSESLGKRKGILGLNMCVAFWMPRASGPGPFVRAGAILEDQYCRCGRVSTNANPLQIWVAV